MGDCCYLSFPGWSGQVARYAGARLVLKELGTGARLSLGTKCLGWSQLSIGSDVGIDKHGYLDASGGMISIGYNSKLNRNVTLNASVGVSIAIGEDCLVGPNLVSSEANHIFADRDVKVREPGREFGNIIISNDEWIAANAINLSKVTIGDQLIVATGAVVTKSFPARSILAGVPAKVIGDWK